MPSLLIESDNTKNLQLLAKLAKQLGDKAKLVSSKKQSLTTEEAHLVSAFKQGDLLKSNKLKTVDARKFLNDLD